MPYTRIPTLPLLSLLLNSILYSVLHASPNSSLLERSPFLPPNDPTKVKPAKPVKNNSPFPKVQFVGFLGTAPDWSLALLFTAQNQVKWLKVGASFADVTILKFDAEVPMLTLEHEGKKEDFKLAQYVPNPPIKAQDRVCERQNPSTKRKTPTRRRIILPQKKKP